MSTNAERREPFSWPLTPEEWARSHIEHQHLCALIKNLPSDFEPWGERSRDSASPSDPMPADCSCGCVFFVGLAEPHAGDWGVCTNPASPRCGLLTFEHQGCPEFVSDCIDDNCEQQMTLADYLRREGLTCTFRCPKCGAEKESLKSVEDERCHSHKSGRKPYTPMVKIEP